jgi:hypothetical protein
MTFAFLARALQFRLFIQAAIDNQDQDVRLLIRTLKQLGATLVLDKEFARKRVLVFNAPKARTGKFPFRFFQTIDVGGSPKNVPSKTVLDSFKQMGYSLGGKLGRGQVYFTKGNYRVQVGAPAAGAGGESQGLTVSFERLL